MASFHPLKVTNIKQETKNSVVLTLQAPKEDATAFQFIQGQYLTFRKEFEGEEIRRSYSICSPVGADELKVGIKKIDGGLFSTWANDELKSGDILNAMPPMGSFHTPICKDNSKHYLGFAGGSGITPFISIIKTILQNEKNSSFTLLYGNQSSNSIMFREELEDLKNIYLSRLSITHILERESQEIDLFNGRIDKERCKELFKNWIDLSSVDMTFICGPEPMMLAISESLKEYGIDESKIKFELFASPKPTKNGGRRRGEATTNNAASVAATIIHDGLSRELDMQKNNKSILDAGLDAGLDLPFACKAGVCSTCKCKVIEGEVEMDANFALEDYEVREGYILSCQSFPITDKVTIDYDR